MIRRWWRKVYPLKSATPPHVPVVTPADEIQLQVTTQRVDAVDRRLTRLLEDHRAMDRRLSKSYRRY